MERWRVLRCNDLRKHSQRRLASGAYKGTLAGPRQKLFGDWEWALEAHLEAIQPLLAKIRDFGFFGNLGIDAYVYQWLGQEKLQPVVEINGRKTMGWAALQIQKRLSPNACLRLSFSPTSGISLNHI